MKQNKLKKFAVDNSLPYMLAQLKFKFSANRHEYMSQFFRENGVCIGKGCNITSNILTGEPWLI